MNGMRRHGRRETYEAHSAHVAALPRARRGGPAGEPSEQHPVRLRPRAQARGLRPGAGTHATVPPRFSTRAIFALIGGCSRYCRCTRLRKRGSTVLDRRRTGPALPLGFSVIRFPASHRAVVLSERFAGQRCKVPSGRRRPTRPRTTRTIIQPSSAVYLSQDHPQRFGRRRPSGSGRGPQTR